MAAKTKGSKPSIGASPVSPTTISISDFVDNESLPVLDCGTFYESVRLGKLKDFCYGREFKAFEVEDWIRVQKFLIDNGRDEYKKWQDQYLKMNKKSDPKYLKLSHHNSSLLYAYIIGRAMNLILYDHSDTMLNVGAQARLIGESYCGLHDENTADSLSKQIDMLYAKLPSHLALRLHKMRENGNSVVHLDIITMAPTEKPEIIRSIYHIGYDAIGYLLSSKMYRKKAEGIYNLRTSIPPGEGTYNPRTYIPPEGESFPYLIISAEKTAKKDFFFERKDEEIFRFMTKMLNKLFFEKRAVSATDMVSGNSHLKFLSNEHATEAIGILTEALKLKTNKFIGLEMSVEKKTDKGLPKKRTEGSTTRAQEKVFHMDREIAFLPAEKEPDGTNKGKGAKMTSTVPAILKFVNDILDTKDAKGKVQRWETERPVGADHSDSGFPRLYFKDDAALRNALALLEKECNKKTTDTEGTVTIQIINKNCTPWDV